MVTGWPQQGYTMVALALEEMRMQEDEKFVYKNSEMRTNEKK